MATMFPDELHEFTTPGEAAVYKFLQSAARPDSSHIVWYSPDIESREPDFILLSPDSGLIVLEVKDWTIDQIIEMTPKDALLMIGDRQERRKQPLAQAREYVNNILSLFSKNAVRNTAGKRELPCPVTWGAIFPHISRNDWEISSFGKVIDTEKLMFWDDIITDSQLSRDSSGNSFRRWITEHFPPMFPFRLTPAKIEWIRNLIFPIVRANIPVRSSISAQSSTLCIFDQEQENMARHLAHSRLLINGPAGSGKTLLLATRAWHLPMVCNKYKHILITCFNLSLGGYIRRLVARRGGSLGKRGIEIIPFYKLCELIIGEKLEHINADSDYYDLVVRETLDCLETGTPIKGRWDAIMVDEGQDFSQAMARVIMKLLPEYGIITIAHDANQRLYQENDAVWESIAGLHIKTLERQYRSTKNISRFAANFLGMKKYECLGVDGSKPKLINCSSINEQVTRIADEVELLLQQGESMSEIAILYFKSGLESGQKIPELLLETLEERGILARWLNRDLFSKNLYDITTDSITISSVHSVKGMDFSTVILAGFEHIKPDNAYLSHLAYVGMTRAREKLYIFGVNLGKDIFRHGDVKCLK